MKRIILILINIFLLGFCFSQDLDNKDVFVFIDISGSMYSDFEEVKDYVNYHIIDNIDPGTRLVLFKFYEKNVCFYDGIMENELSFQYAKSLVNSLKANGPWTNLDNIKIYLQGNKLSVENSRIYILSDGFIQEKDFANEYYVTDEFWNGLGIIYERVYDKFYLYKFDENITLNRSSITQEIDELSKYNQSYNRKNYFKNILLLLIIVLLVLGIILLNKFTTKIVLMITKNDLLKSNSILDIFSYMITKITGNPCELFRKLTEEELIEANKYLKFGVVQKLKSVRWNGEDKISNRFFPQFNYYFKVRIPKKLYEKSDTEQFRYCDEIFSRKFLNNNKFRKKILSKFVDPLVKEYEEKGYEGWSSIKEARNMFSEQVKLEHTPPGGVWHHYEGRKGEIQLVWRHIHENVSHEGGRSIWGGGSHKR